MVSESSDIQNFLKQHPLFKGMDRAQLEFASNNVLVAYGKAGAQLDFEQSAARKRIGMLIIRSGSLEVRKGDNQLVDRLSTGDYFFISHLKTIIEDQDHIKALEDCLYYELSERALQSLSANNSELASLSSKDIARRTAEHSTEQIDDKSNIKDIRLARQVKDYMSSTLVHTELGTSIHHAAKLMHEKNISSLLIKREEALVGILTDRDLRNRVLAQDKDKSDTIDSIMTPSPICVSAHTLLHEAQLKMMQEGVHHLPVVKNGKPIGMLSASDILRANNLEPLSLNKGVSTANSPEEIASVSKKIPELVAKLIERDTRAVEVGEIITSLSDAITKKLIALAIEKFGKAPCEYAWIAFGSQARQEQVLGSDQDNGLILSDKVEGSHLDYFKQFAQFVNDGLDLCGMPYCPGDIMASNAKWRLPLKGWQRCFLNWIEERSPKDLMHASIFFDMRHIAGAEFLSQELQRYVLEKAKSNTIFIALMCGNAMQHTPPLGFFKTFVLERDGDHNNTLDLKKRGTIPIVDIARNYALASGLEPLNTIERLEALIELDAMSKPMARSLIDAHEFIAGIRLAAQGKEFQEEREIDNYLDPKDLSPLVRHQLKEAFSLVREAQAAMKMRLAASAL